MRFSARIAGVFALSAFALDASAAVPKGSTAGGDADVWAIAAKAKAQKGVEQTRAVYELWNEWELADPIAVTHALEGIAEDAAIDPSTRATAESFASAARLQIGDAAGARLHAEHAGLVGKWLVVGPFDHEGRSGFVPEIGPEIDRLGLLALAATYDGKDHRGVHWRLFPGDAAPYGIVDLAAAIRPSTNACVYATTFVAAPEDPKDPKKKAAAIDASLWVGASGALRVFWNGERVIEDAAERGLTFDRLATSVTISPGWNRLLVKVCGAERAPSFALRVADAKGAPIAGLRVDPDPRHATEVEGKPQKAPAKIPAPPPKAEAPKPKPKPEAPKPKPEEPTPEEKKPPKLGEPVPEKPVPTPKGESKKPPVSPSGPLVISEPTTTGKAKSLFQVLLARVAGDKPNAGDLEALARYMHDTMADDPTRHDARDLATRAADAGPTVERLLLAAELAEDRNQRRSFLEKATALSAKKRVDVLYAFGQLEASGPDPDAALPYFDRALAIDPDDLPSIVARADLLASVGLKRTARKEIEAAIATHPRVRALLHRWAALLAVDSPTDADDVRARHDELGMTSGAYLSDLLQDAVDVRDAGKAKAVVQRWRSIDPTGDVPIKEGAGALEKLGDVDGAAALYEAGLDVSPDDPAVMVALADLEGRRGKRDVQLRLYKQVYARWPQLTGVRDYLESAEPSAPREDEVFAEGSDVFLKRKTFSAVGFDTRILTQIQVTTVQPNGLSARFHQIAYQPLTAEAAARGRHYAFGFQSDVETVTLRAARIIHKDGKIDEATESGERRNDDPSISMYSSSRVYYVSFPNLQVGDVVELRYRIEDTTPRNAFGDYFGEVAYLQNDEPTAHMEYVLRAPKGRALSIHAPKNPAVKFTQEDKGDLHVMRWVASDLPGTIAEEKMPPWAEVLDHVQVSTYAEWNDLGAWYWNLIKEQYVADDAVREKVKELTKGLTKNEDKVRAIYDWVVQDTRYVALEFGIHGFKPYRCAQIFARGFGDCKDKATLIVTMLKEAGIDATPVMVRTNLRGDIETTPPSLAVFDHMIAYVPSMDLYLDGTAEDHGSTELPSMDRGALAVRVQEGKPVIVHLPDPPPSESTRFFTLEADFKADLSATLELSLEGTGSYAPRLRARYRTTSTAAQKLNEDMPTDLAQAEWTNVTPGALEDLEKKPTLAAKGKAPAIGRADGDKRSLPITTLGSLVATWAPLSDRKQDVRFWGTQAVDDKYVYKFPANVKIERTPEAKKGTSPFGSYAVEVESSKGTMKIHVHFELAVSRVHPKDYAAFRAFLREADVALSQRVIVKG